MNHISDSYKKKIMLPVNSNSLFNSNSPVNSEHNLKIRNLRESENFLSNDGAFALEFLDKNLISPEYPTLDLIARGPAMKVSIRKSSDGRIKPLQIRSSPWIRHIKLAPDVHSPNALIELTESRRVRLRITKNVASDEEIVAWFSEEMLAFMAIPFLTPVNIIENNCYRCHVCHKSFETPNPLKIHIAITCGQQSADILWTRLHYGIHEVSFLPQSLSRETTSSPQERNGTQIDLSSKYFSPTTLMTPRNVSFGQTLSLLPPSSPASASTAAQIETIVSNMGSSKQGHLCIYCGKIYSRKYGLKIHIRTHTGFKPLKCKFCLRPFGDPSNLNKHVRLHMQAGSSTYRCRFCSKAMARKRDLNRHIRTVHSDMPESMNLSSSSDDD